jgi:hypothetical protein
MNGRHQDANVAGRGGWSPCVDPVCRFWGTVRLVAAVGLVALLAGPGLAQPAGPQRLEQADRVGTVMAIAPGRIQVRLKNSGDMWVVAAAPGASVEVTGTASREMLMPKQFVECSVDLYAFGKVTQPIGKVIFPGSGTPGVAGSASGSTDPKAKRAPGKRPAGNYLVSGFIKSVDGDTIVVQVGRDRFEIPVAADAELEVATANLAIATVGDEVELEGEYLQKGQLLASSIKVTLTNPLMPPPAKGKGKRPAASP